MCIRDSSKENGGHGSTINYAIPRATGKYFKVVDGDDWLDKSLLPQFVQLLKHTHSDVISNDFNLVDDRTKTVSYTHLNDMDFHRGTFRVHGDVLDIFPANADDTAIRVELFGDEIERIVEVDVLTGEVKCSLEHTMIFPASHYVVSQEKINEACLNIEKERCV